jgi:hypothetical protein
MNSKWNGKWLVRLSLALVCTLVVVLLLVSWSKRTHAQNHTPVHLTTDWSNRHMIYSAPSSMMQGRMMQAEPRYQHQLMRRNAPAMQAQGAQ